LVWPLGQGHAIFRKASLSRLSETGRCCSKNDSSAAIVTCLSDDACGYMIVVIAPCQSQIDSYTAKNGDILNPSYDS